MLNAATVIPPAGKVMLAVEPVTHRFAAGREDAGEEALKRQLAYHSQTEPVLIEKLQDVLLDGQGLVQKRYRLTMTALSQLCWIVAPGFGSAVRNLAGLLRRTKKFSNETYSVSRTIELLNAGLRMRWSLLDRTYRLIVDYRARQIEGFVGPSYHFISNLTVYEWVAEYMRGRGAEFSEAALFGRRLQLRYKNRQACFDIPEAGGKLRPFHGGWHWANSELGNCCLQGSCLLYGGAWSAMVPYDRASKLIHRGSASFNDRFQKLMEHTQDRISRIRGLRKFVLDARAELLEMGHTEKARQKCREDLESLLKKGGVPKRAAIETVARLSTQGQALELPTAQALRQDPIGRLGEVKVTRYDVCATVCRQARRLRVDQQELAEQAAYRLLLGPLKIHKELT